MSRLLALRRRLRAILTDLCTRLAFSRRRGAKLTPAFHLEGLEVRVLLDGNAAPVNSVPADQLTQVNLPLTFTSARGNLISISDTDAGTNPIQVTLTAAHGQISLHDPTLRGGLTYLSGDGDSDREMTFTGSIGDINHALEWLVFRPDQDYVGAEASITMSTSDLHPGVDGPGVDTDSIPIAVQEVPGTDLIFDVTAFGAVGNGSVDDAPAIRATIAAAIAAGGGTILFPPGAYRLDSFDPAFSSKAHFYLANCEGLRFSGYGAQLNSTSTVASDLFYLNGARRMEFEGFSIDGRFSRNGSQITQQSIGGFFVTSTQRDSESIRFADIQVTDSYFFLRTFSDLTYSTRLRDVSVDNCAFANGFYGLNLANNCDDFTCRGFTTTGLVRSYFVYGVDRHDVEYISHGGDTFTDCVLKAFQRETTDILVKATVIGNTSHDAKCDFESQHDPSTQPVPAKIRNVLIDFDDTQSSGPKSVRFAYFRTPGPVQTSIAPSDLFENIIVRGAARNATDFAVLQPDPVNIDTTGLVLSSRPTLVGPSVNENAPTGTVVGFASLPDEITGGLPGTLYSLLDDAGGRFAIDPRTGLVFAVRTALLNYEVATSHDITVQAVNTDGATNIATFTIQVNDVNEFSISSVADLDAAANSVPENSPNGTSVGITAFAVDQDGTRNAVTYSLTTDAGGRFTIDSATGVVMVANSSLIDREQASAWSITVKAASADGTSSLRSYTVQVEEVNEFAVSPVADVNNAANAVAENVANGTLVGITARATDRDYGAVVSYSLQDSAGGRFAIDPASGVVTVADGRNIDRELAASYTIVVQATSNDGSVSLQPFSIAVSDVNEFSISALVDADFTANSVLEGAADGTPVGLTASAADLDATRSTVTYSLTANAGGRFAINATSGVVTVANGQLLDREQAASWSITVLATSQDGSSSSRSYTVTVDDVNEYGVTPAADVDAAANSVVEGVANGTLVGITARSSDRDATNNLVTYSLQNSAGGRFAIDSQTGVVTVAEGSLIDCEVATSHTIVVQSASSDGSTSLQSFTISVADINEFSIGGIANVSGSGDAGVVSIPENLAGGASVGITAKAVDQDATNSRVTYSLTNSANGRFEINPGTGVVTVAKSAIMDRETASAFLITVQASSQDGSKSSRSFTIMIDDVNEFAVTPASDVDSAANSIGEGAANGTLVGITALAVDRDATNSLVTYSLQNNAGGRFAIDSQTGVVTVLDGSLIDRELAAGYTIVVKAASTDGSTSQQSFVISVGDVNEFSIGQIANTSGPGDANVVAIPENAPGGFQVGITARAVDQDATNSRVTYTLPNNAGGRFEINADSGVITTVKGAILDRETASGFLITVLATSQDGTTATRSFAINLIDLNDNPVSPVGDADATPNLVLEQAPNGTVVGITAFATDPDVSNIGFPMTYSLNDSSDGRYQIDPVTGVVSVADGSRIDYETTTANTINVKATAADGSWQSRTFAIQVQDVLETSTLDLSNNSVAENLPIDSVVGNLGVLQALPVSPVFTLVSGAGSTNNGSFKIVGNQLRTKARLNFEAGGTLSVRVQMTSANGIKAVQVFTINVTDVNEAPTGLSLSRTSVPRNAAPGTTIGLLSAIDPDTGSSFSYTLVAGDGAIDNERVLIVGNELVVNAPLTGTKLSIRVRVTDAFGLSYEKVLTIKLTKAQPAPV